MIQRVLLALSVVCFATPAMGQTAIDPALTPLLCGQEPTCRVMAAYDAGSGEQGEKLSIVMTERPEPPADTYFVGLVCQPGYQEYWLLQQGAEPKRLLQLCNDGYGAAGVGEDVIEVGNNLLYHQQSGGSAWRWSSAWDLMLSPTQILTESWTSYWALGLNHAEGSWDWSNFSNGRERWWAPACGPDGYAPELPEQTEPDYETMLIPMLSADALPRGLEDADLGSCALQVDGYNGYVVYGDATEAQNDGDWFSVTALEPDRLLVTVYSRAVMSGAKTWLGDDHLEIWQGDAIFDTCLTGQEQARQWAIMLADGKVYGAENASEALPEVLTQKRSTQQDGSIATTFEIRLVEAIGPITVVLSKGDGKKRQKWLLATSLLEFGKAPTLGRVYGIMPEAARCEIVGGFLEVIEAGNPALLGIP